VLFCFATETGGLRPAGFISNPFICPMKTPFRLFIALLALATLARAQTAPSGQSPIIPLDARQEARLAWFRQARLGMFIHWGLYAIPAGQWPGRTSTSRAEWIMLQENIPSAEYEKLAPQFDPVKFDAKAWVAVAKAAGMKYIVVTAKHHDGFSMFATKQTDYNIVDATPFKRDPLKELAAACHDAGIMFCVYYSIADWHYPDSPAQYSQLARNPITDEKIPNRGFHGAPNPAADVKKYDAYMRAQVRELLTNYGPVGLVWFDGGGSYRLPNRAEILEADQMAAMIHELQPGTLINNRLGVAADYGTPEQRIPNASSVEPFEVCMTLNKHWGYNRFDHDWKNPAVVVRNIADIVSKGGNYLLNVGPTAEGVIPPEAVAILQQVGAWTSLNAEAIYGAGGTPFGAELGGDDWRCTTQRGRLYFHLLKWPDGKFTVPGLANKVIKAYFLADPAHTPVAATADGHGTTFALPAQPPAALAPVLCVEIEGSVKPASAKGKLDTTKDTAS